MTRSRAVRGTIQHGPRRLASRAGRIAVAVTLVIAAAVSGLTVAFAGTGRGTRGTGGQAPRPPAAAVSPGVPSQPGALPVAEPHTGPGWMSHQLMVRTPGWNGARAVCTSMPRSIPDSQAARPAGGCGTPQLTAPAPRGYGPARLSAYLRLRGTGTGQTVAVVDAYDNPYAVRDIARYSRRFGLPAPCGAPARHGTGGCFRFSVVHPFGFAGVDPGWALESDLDIQMVHAIAPKASIILVEAYDNSWTSMFQGISYAAGRRPSPAVISNSWGGAEFSGETAADRHCALTRSLCVFAAGDNGNPGLYPAYDPYAVSVGGTTLVLRPDGQVGFETAWCCGPFPGAAGGGGVSRHEPPPSYQGSVNRYRGRGIPDVSFDADPVTGVPVYDTFGLNGQNGWFEVGGTSVGTPAWAGILAAADQRRASAGKATLHGAGFQAQSLLYGMSHGGGFGDITQGVDNLFGCTSPVRACAAHPGYDLVTGWGSPRPGIDSSLARAR